jgi:nitric oxide synthase oxygenase domain/subunit
VDQEEGKGVRRLTRKRLHWVAGIVSMTGPYAGQKHHDRWPCKHPWKNCRCLGDLNARSLNRG